MPVERQILRATSRDLQIQLPPSLVNRLVEVIVREIDETPPAAQPTAAEILQQTRGSWGNLSVDEIDAQLDRDRHFDWGE